MAFVVDNFNNNNFDNVACTAAGTSFSDLLHCVNSHLNVPHHVSYSTCHVGAICKDDQQHLLNEEANCNFLSTLYSLHAAFLREQMKEAVLGLMMSPGLNTTTDLINDSRHRPCRNSIVNQALKGSILNDRQPKPAKITRHRSPPPQGQKSNLGGGQRIPLNNEKEQAHD